MNPWILYVCVAAVVMGGIYPLYAGERLKKKSVASTALKGLGTLLAAGLAFWGYIRHPDTTSLLLTLGLTICAVADMAIVYHFLAGMLLFLGGHLLYLGAFLKLEAFHPVSLILFACIFTALLVFFWPERKRRKNLASYIFYMAVITAMLSVALTLSGVRGMTLAIGAALFFASDFLLAVGATRGSFPGKSYAVMGFYYAGQLILALGAVQPWR
jgi:uncharacterized membrane protein YhhN